MPSPIGVSRQCGPWWLSWVVAHLVTIGSFSASSSFRSSIKRTPGTNEHDRGDKLFQSINCQGTTIHILVTSQTTISWHLHFRGQALLVQFLSFHKSSYFSPFTIFPLSPSALLRNRWVTYITVYLNTTSLL